MPGHTHAQAPGLGWRDTRTRARGLAYLKWASDEQVRAFARAFPCHAVRLASWGILLPAREVLLFEARAVRAVLRELGMRAGKVESYLRKWY